MDPEQRAGTLPTSRTRVVLLGTGGGPRVMSAHRYGISTAVVYGDDVYLVDLGAGSPMRIIEAGLAGPGPIPAILERVRGILFTHLHTDHTVEWPMVFATGAINRGHVVTDPIRVFGPGDRGTLPRVHPPSRPEPAVVAPDEPTPGIVGMSRHLEAAFANDFNDRHRDSAMKTTQDTFVITDIEIPWEVDAEGVPPRLDAPLEIWQDGEVRVTATLVDHHPTAPAFAFRFDTPDGSVVISGDTCVSDNLIDLARGADVLLHEVIDPSFADRLTADMAPEYAVSIKAHLLESHTTIEQVGPEVAERAGVGTLVLHHLVPHTTPREQWLAAQTGFSGQLIVGEDLMEIPVGSAASTAEGAR